MNKSFLTKTKPCIMFWAFIITSGYSAPSMRVLRFKEENDLPEISSSARAGACLVIREQISGFFIVHKSLGVIMQQPCSNCQQNATPIDRLTKQFALISFAVEGTIQIIQSDYSNIPSINAFGLQIAWDEFTDSLESYMTSKGDDYSLIAGGK